MKSDLLEFTSSSPVLSLSACMFTTPDIIKPFGNGAGEVVVTANRLTVGLGH